ncbi:YNFM family putative membrane transporter [Paenibacillus cellulosilyticus]|uniref:YNFM family putative membrane transporter n=1 Tax=Paenibacillus cellulosilyticus TaxID=375489 RepID=A0A2V2Z7E4_9BACL|nr:MFS transporter [Paenibacillus cellulosilyticus]PWW07286.1 YNFM family putative membrane transporter [Paenibacillus cellulosilyticus]QKS44526.1 MFS transporter [Paenibacillus cellulosilyticus]
MSYLQSGQPEYTRASLALFGGAFVTFAELYATQPLMPELSDRFQVSPALSSLSLSVATIGLAAALPFVAGISDRWGRKRVMSVSLVASAALSVLIACSPSFALLLVLRLIQGILIAGFPSIAMAYVNEEFLPEENARAMGLYVSGTTVGGMAGRIAISALADGFSWRIALLVVGLLNLAIALWFWRALPKPGHSEPKRISRAELRTKLLLALHNRSLIELYALGFLLMGGFVAMYNYAGYLLTGEPYHLSQTIVGLVFVVYLTGTFSSAWMGKLADRIGRSRTLRMAIIIAFAGCLMTFLSPLYAKIAGLACFTFGFFGAHAVVSGWVGQLAAGCRAQASSFYLLFYYAGSSVAGFMGGVFWNHFGWGGVVGMVATILMLACLVERLVSLSVAGKRKNIAGIAAQGGR